MNQISTGIATVAFITLIGCGGNGTGNVDAMVTTQTAVGTELCSEDTFATGTVSRNFTPTTWNEPFVASEDAHIQIQLSTAFIDGPATVLVDQDIPFTPLPFEFTICGNNTEIELTRQGELFISVNVYNHTGFDARVGDLVNEFFNSVDGPSRDLDILVSGLEHCDSPNSGGFCTTNF